MRELWNRFKAKDRALLRLLLIWHHPMPSRTAGRFVLRGTMIIGGDPSLYFASNRVSSSNLVTIRIEELNQAGKFSAACCRDALRIKHTCEIR